MKKISLFLLLNLVLSAHGLLIGADKIELIKGKIAAGAKIIDVRTPKEYGENHYKNAINIPISDIESRLAEVGDKNKPVILYCLSGKRSAKAAKILSENGFSDVINAGGLDDMP